MKREPKIDVLALAQKCVALIETTKMVATYKPATFIALLNVITQQVDKRARQRWQPALGRWHRPEHDHRIATCGTQFL